MFDGEIFTATFFQSAFTLPASRTPPNDPRVLMLAGPGAGTGGAVILASGAGPRVRSFRAVESNFTVGCNVSFDTSASQTGYLWAKSNMAGTVRRMALYANSAGLRFFYKAVGQATHSSAMFAVTGLFDGAFHTVVLGVSGRVATVVVDGVPLVSVQLVGEVDDCSDADAGCVFYVGQRSDASTNTWRMTGTIAAAILRYSEMRTQL